jgi:hypothetical protein
MHRCATDGLPYNEGECLPRGREIDGEISSSSYLITSVNQRVGSCTEPHLGQSIRINCARSGGYQSNIQTVKPIGDNIHSYVWPLLGNWEDSTGLATAHSSCCQSRLWLVKSRYLV